MAIKKKFYVVWQGNNPGIYESWEDCQIQIKGFPQAKFKSFPNQDEAIKAFRGKFSDHISKSKPTIKASINSSKSQILKNTWSVDAACSGNPGKMEYRGVETDSGNEIFKQGPFENGTNNIGEFLAIVHALALLKKIGDNSKTIYTDSKTAISWVKNKKVKTLLKKDKTNEIIFDLIDRALKWLNSNSYNNKIIKWETKSWGEIPADFGRK